MRNVNQWGRASAPTPRERFVAQEFVTNALVPNELLSRKLVSKAFGATRCFTKQASAGAACHA